MEEDNSSHKKTDSCKHIAVIPWFAHGHILPILDLSILLSAKGHRVTLISTPANICMMKTSLGGDDLLHFAEVPMPVVDGLPSGKENTRDVEISQIHRLIDAMQMLYNPFKRLLAQLSPHCVISDFFVPPSAFDLGVPNMSLVLTTAAIFTNNWQENSTNPLFNDSALREHMLSFTSKISRCSETWREKCSGMLADTCTEIEGEYVQEVEVKFNKPVYAIGPLLSRVRPLPNSSNVKLMAWLEMKPQCSAIYVAFGSECPVSEEQSEEIALGLEASGVPFIWVVGRCKLPEGFAERVDGKQGMIMRGWVPQREILSNIKVGGFMSHCGWNSVKEAVTAGVSVVAVPMQYDQKFNARFVTYRLNTGVQVEIGSNGLYGRKSVRKCVRRVMVEDQDVRRRAQELATVLSDRVLQPDGSRDRHINKFVDFIGKTVDIRPHQSIMTGSRHRTA